MSSKMKTIIISMLLSISCLIAKSQDHYNSSNQISRQIAEFSQYVSTEKQDDARGAYILKTGAAYKYYSHKSRFPSIGAPHQDYTDPFQGMLMSPQSYFTIEVSASTITIHCRELLQVYCGFSGPNNDPAVPTQIQWTVLPQRQNKTGKLTAFFDKDLSYNVTSTAKHLIFQTPRTVVIMGGVDIMNPDYLESKAIAMGGAPQNNQTGMWVTNKYTGKRRGMDDIYAPWRIVQDQKLTISLDAMAKTNGMTKNDLVWTLFFTDLSNLKIVSSVNAHFDEDANAAFHFLLDKTFGLTKKIAQGEKYASAKLVEREKVVKAKEEEARLAREQRRQELLSQLPEMEKSMQSIMDKLPVICSDQEDLKDLGKIKSYLAELVPYNGNEQLDNLDKNAALFHFILNYKYSPQMGQWEAMFREAKLVSGRPKDVIITQVDPIIAERYCLILRLLSSAAMAKGDYYDSMQLIKGSLDCESMLGVKRPEVVSDIKNYAECMFKRNFYSDSQLKDYIEYFEPAVSADDRRDMYMQLYNVYMAEGKNSKAKKIMKKINSKK